MVSITTANKMASEERSNVFLIMATGELESAKFPEYDRLYCNYSIVQGQDWTILSGTSEGMTQTSLRGSANDNNFIWNYPIDITFKSTNPYGWPQIVISVYGINGLGRDEVRGYGSIHIPVTSGSHVLDVPMFVPEPASKLQKFISWLIGPQPEFIDPKFVAKSEGREITRVSSQGFVRVKLNIIIKDFNKQGFRNHSSIQS